MAAGGDDRAGGAPLQIRPAKDGPLLVAGDVAVVSHEGDERWSGTKTALCRCGHSQNKPFCDGSHAKAGFQGD